MHRTLRPLSGAILVAALALAAGAQGHDHGPSSDTISGEVGVVHFANSGSAAAQEPFLRGLALLHSFEYPAARKAFQDARAVDPGFAMAAWGEALTYNHSLWNEQDTAAARAVLASLGATAEERIARGATPRERDYLAAVEKLYGPGTKSERNAAYSAALYALSRRYPDDLDARALYALSLLALSPIRNHATYMRAAAEAEAVYDVDKLHPGGLHYMIHAYDDPVHAPLGLRAARLYARVAPGAAHAQHMTTHIFIALGLWDETIAGNEASLRIARSHGDPNYHSLLWLEYAYLQRGRRESAAALLRSVTQDVASGPTRENRLRLAYARAVWLVETRGAPESGAGDAIDGAGITSIGNFAVHDFARGVALAQAGDPGRAGAALAALRKRCAEARAQPPGENPAWYDAMTPNELAEARTLAAALDAVIAFYGGDHAGGLAGIRSAISTASTFEFEYGPPWSAKPLDELLGEMLLADRRYGEAAEAFKAALAAFPNRRLANEGLATALRAGAEPPAVTEPPRANTP
jgi:tetratricopeptide (TPR) repeat protein